MGDIEKAGYQTAEQVQAAIAASGHAHFEVAETDPTAEGFAAQANVMYLYMNSKTKHYDIYAKVGESVVLLDDTTVDLSEYAKTADVTSAISTAIAALNIDQYATDEDLTAAVARVTALETAIANVYTKKEVDDKLAARWIRPAWTPTPPTRRPSRPPPTPLPVLRPATPSSTPP